MRHRLFRTLSLCLMLGCLPMSFSVVSATAPDTQHKASLILAQLSDDVPMPNLSSLIRRTDLTARNTGRLIKGIYYAHEPGGPNTYLSFYNSCFHILEDRPFLIVDFRADTYFFDTNRNGFTSEMGRLLHSEIDPVDFYARLADSATYCYGAGHAS